MCHDFIVLPNWSLDILHCGHVTGLTLPYWQPCNFLGLNNGLFVRHSVRSSNRWFALFFPIAFEELEFILSTGMQEKMWSQVLRWACFALEELVPVWKLQLCFESGIGLWSCSAAKDLRFFFLEFILQRYHPASHQSWGVIAVACFLLTPPMVCNRIMSVIPPLY